MTTTTRRLHGVDALRGVAIIAVVLLHTNIRFHLEKTSFGVLIPAQVMRVVLWNGFYAVKVFFVVSGYLITSSILSRWGELSRIDLRRFYWLRFARIGPCLLGLLAVLSLLHITGTQGFVIKRTSLPNALAAALTFQVNWLEAKVGYLPGSWDILWSLSVEEVFYLLYPLLCRFVKVQWIFWAIVSSVICIGPFYESVWAANPMDSEYGYLSNMEGIAIGCVVAVLSRRRVLPFAALATGWIFFVLVAIVRLRAISKLGLDVSALEAGTGLAVWGMAQGKNAAPKWASVFRWFGGNSYEVYLTHMFVVTEATLFFAESKWKWFWTLMILIAAGVLGDLVRRLYSERMNNWLRRIA